MPDRKIIQPQFQKSFFDPTPDRRWPKLPPPPSSDEIRAKLDDPQTPLNQIVVSERNQGGMHVLRLFAYTAMTRYNRSCRGMSYGIYSGPGQGKTSVVKKWVETIGIPFIFVQSDALESTWQLFQMIAKEHAEWNQPLQPQTSEQHFYIPPCIVFFDEAHALSKDLRTGGLLNAMELKDGWLRTQPPGKNQKTILVDCSQVCWVAATTDPGLLFAQSQAFYERFTNHIVWHSAGPKEIASIVKKNNTEISDEACALVAHYVPNPRRAIAFAEQMVMERNMYWGSWAEAARKVAHINGIDEYGMTYQQVNLLKALGHKPIAANRLSIFAKCRKEELDKIILPPLLDDVEGRGPLIESTSKGFAVTRAGLRELDKRGIDHNGDDIIAERIR